MPKNPKSAASEQMAKIVGLQIRKHRHAAKISQEALADTIGIHRTQIGFLERGENTTSIHALALIAQALGTTASEILRECGY